MPLFPSDEWADAVISSVNDDQYFNRIADYFDATVLFGFGDDEYAFTLRDGEVRAYHEQPRFLEWNVAIRAPMDTWEKFLSVSPPPFHNDLRSVWMQHDITIEGDLTTALQQWRSLKYLIDVFGEVHR
jgi:hypothetical protein